MTIALQCSCLRNACPRGSPWVSTSNGSLNAQPSTPRTRVYTKLFSVVVIDVLRAASTIETFTTRGPCRPQAARAQYRQVPGTQLAAPHFLFFLPPNTTACKAWVTDLTSAAPPPPPEPVLARVSSCSDSSLPSQMGNLISGGWVGGGGGGGGCQMDDDGGLIGTM
jgi:hypothetical protein